MSQTGGGGGAIPIRRPSLVQAKLAAEAKQAAEKMSVKFHGDGGDGDSGSRHGSFIEHGGSTRKLDAMKARLSYSAGTQAREGSASSLGEGGQRSELRRVFRAFDGDNGFEIEPQEFQAALMALGFEGAEGKRLSCNTRAHTRPSWSRPHGDALFPVFARPLLPLCLLPPSRPWSHLPDPGLSPVLPPYPRTPAIRSLPHPFPLPHHLPHTQPPDPSAIAKVFAEIDTSADGKISEDEFIRFFADNSMEEMKRRVQTLHDDNKHAIVRCLEFPIGGLAQHGNGG